LTAIPSLDFFVSGLGVPAGNQWGTALALRTEDLFEKRKKGSAYWFGWAGTFGHIDPETGLAAFFATQVPPSPDGELFQVYEECERILYSNLEKD
jgi:CubicO group peptidase (beta-lactamase class C family)